MSDPLDHLLSVDLGESSPMSDVFENEVKTQAKLETKKVVKRVRFVDMLDESCSSVDTSGSSETNESKLSSIKGILKSVKTSNFDDSIGGWSTQGYTGPVKVSIMSSFEDYSDDEIAQDDEENYEDQIVLNDEENSDYQIMPDDDESLGNQNDRPISSEVVLDDESTYSRKMDSNDNNDSSTESKLENANEVDFKLSESDHEKYLVQDESNGGLHETASGHLEINKFFEGQNVNEKSQCHNNIVNNFGLERQELTDEIRKMSKELFVETVSLLDEQTGKSHDGTDVNDNILPYKSFICAENVNDILDHIKLYYKGSENAKVSQKTCIKPVKSNQNVHPISKVYKEENYTKKSDSRARRPSSPYSVKLRQVLEENLPEKLTAKDLRTIAFQAWCAIKAEEEKSLLQKHKSHERCTQDSALKEKSLKEASAIKAFLIWKEQKEKIMKLKKEDEMKAAQTKLSKVLDDKKKKKEEATLVFNCWRKNKDEELKRNLRKQNWNTRKISLNKVQSEEMKKLDAVAAFNAWKSQKSLELLRKEKEHLMKKEFEATLTEQERAERDKEALRAYEIWLEYKDQYEDTDVWKNHPKFKPPWTPPGRISS